MPEVTGRPRFTLANIMEINGIPAEWYARGNEPDSPKGIRLRPSAGTNRRQISVAITKAMEVEGCEMIDVVDNRWRYGHGKHK